MNDLKLEQLSKHTGGKWEVWQSNPLSKPQIVSRQTINGEQYLQGVCKDFDDFNIVENLNLCAAAPEMLADIKTLRAALVACRLALIEHGGRYRRCQEKYLVELAAKALGMS